MPFLKYTWAIIMRSLVIRRRVRPSSVLGGSSSHGMLGARGFDGVHCCCVFIENPRLAEFLVDLQIQRDCLGVGLVREPDDGHELGVLFGVNPLLRAAARASNAVRAAVGHADRQ